MILKFFLLYSSVQSLLSAVLMLTRPNPVISALFLVLNFFSLAGLYLTLNAQFIAVAQVIVYAGAIMVFFLFVLMLLNPEKEKRFFEQKAKLRIFILAIVALVLVQIVYIIFLSRPSDVITREVARSVRQAQLKISDEKCSQITFYLLKLPVIYYSLQLSVP